MVHDISKSNYLEWLKLVQRLYAAGILSAIFALSHALTSDKASLNNMLIVPGIGVELPRAPAIAFALGIFLLSGLVILYSYTRLRCLDKSLPHEVVKALRNYPSIANASWKIELIIVSAIIVIITAVFSAGEKPVSSLESLGSAITISGGYVCAFWYKAYNQSFKRIAKNAPA